MKEDLHRRNHKDVYIPGEDDWSIAYKDKRGYTITDDHKTGKLSTTLTS